MSTEVDITIVGAGIIGLTTAYALLQRDPSLSLQIIEKELGPGLHQSSRNSGVIHSGVYYKPGSLKAKNCREGRQILLDFCDEHKIPYKQSHKLIVATKKEELIRLEALMQNGCAHGLSKLEIISKEQMREIEPHIAGVKALYIPDCHVIRFADVTNRLAELLPKKGAEVRYGEKVLKLHRKNATCVIETTRSSYSTKAVINCAGLYSDRIAALTGENKNLKIIPFRGEYFEVIPEKQHWIKGLVYPVPDPRFPFLGVHLTRMMNGKLEVGPNAVLAFAREGYRRSQVDFRDCWDILSYQGFWQMSKRYWDKGFYEMARSTIKKLFVHDVQKLLPCVQERHLVRGMTGVRAQVVSKDGKMVDDFVFKEDGRILHVINAPSPAATASFSIGNSLADLYFAEMR